MKLVALVSLIGLAACSGGGPADAVSYNVLSNVSYGPLALQKMDVCLPVPTVGTRRAVLIVHGGGYVTGDKADKLALCKSLATRGFVAATINYRLLGNPPVGWPNPLADAKLAVQFLRSQSAAYGLDPNKLCAYGFSAGGHLATLLSITSEVTAKVNCAVLISGVPDQARCHTISGDDSAYPPLIANASTAPTYMVAGTLDPNTPYADTVHYLSVLVGLGVTAKMASYVGGHDWRNADPVERATIEADIVTWMQTVP